MLPALTMNCAQNRCNDPAEPRAQPSKDLFIYYLKGRLRVDEKILSNNFIGNWQEDDTSFLFFSEPSRREVEKILKQQPCLTLLDQFHMPYNQWHGSKISPVRIGRFYIAPPWQKSWDKRNPHDNELPIVLDPGVVFGTGTHITTRDCLKALELAFSGTKIESVLDLGTGTGLLALAAAKLGCDTTIAVDLNFLAARTALRNVQLNHLEGKVLIVQGKAKDFIDSPCDLVIANIQYDVMKALVTSQGFLSKKWFILSGLLRSEARDLLFILSQQHLKILEKWEGEGIWHTFFGEIC